MMIEATTTGSYRCCCGSDQPSFVLTLVAAEGVGEIPSFKLRIPVANFASSSYVSEETLCGYLVRNSKGFLWPFYTSYGGGGYSYKPSRFYRLVYRGKNGSGGTLPPASARSHDDNTVEAELEERRLMATEESRQRYSIQGFMN